MAGATVKISHLTIRNHARVPDLELEVREHMVLVGANDVGKTSLLRLLQFTLGSSTGHLYQSLSLSDLRDAASALIVDIVLTAFNDDDRAVFHREISIDPIGKKESLSLRLEVSADGDDPGAIVIRRWFPERGDDRGPTREQLRAFGWRYLPATRGISAAQLGGPNSALRTLLDAIDLGAE
jgi:putative ATP-dependent endonuclease of OLD family